MTVRKLRDFEQVTLFMYVLTHGLPEWAERSEVKVYARLMNITEEQALRKFERAKQCGYLDKVDTDSGAEIQAKGLALKDGSGYGKEPGRQTNPLPDRKARHARSDP